ncbi:MAG: molybdate ABC transporter substrate-binding protein [Agarilytica sp.]
MIMPRRAFICLCWMLGACPVFAVSDNALRVAAASNFMPVAVQLRELFCEGRGSDCKDQIVFTFASSGKLYSQIIHGAPYHIFMSADVEKPVRLIEDGFAEASSLHVYAKGKLVFASRNVLEFQSESFVKKLVNAKVAVANPKLAPYGQASIEALEHFSGFDREQVKLVYGENIAQVFHMFISGAVEFAFLSASQVLLSPEGQEPTIYYWPLPNNYHSAIEQALVLLNSHGQHKNRAENTLAKAFVTFLSSDAATAKIRQSGYD